MHGRLAQVAECYDVTRLIVVTFLIRYPYLYLVDRYPARDVWHRRHRLLVLVAEEITEEEMSVLVVVIAADVKLRRLCSAFTAYRLCLAVLLTD